MNYRRNDKTACPVRDEICYSLHPYRDLECLLGWWFYKYHIPNGMNYKGNDRAACPDRDKDISKNCLDKKPKSRKERDMLLIASLTGF